MNKATAFRKDTLDLALNRIEAAIHVGWSGQRTRSLPSEFTLKGFSISTRRSARRGDSTNPAELKEQIPALKAISPAPGQRWGQQTRPNKKNNNINYETETVSSNARVPKLAGHEGPRGLDQPQSGLH
jgi:hypothetical protein